MPQLPAEHRLVRCTACLSCALAQPVSLAAHLPASGLYLKVRRHTSWCGVSKERPSKIVTSKLAWDNVIHLNLVISMDQKPTIASLCRSCNTLLKLYESRAPPKQKGLVNERLASFSFWTKNIGAFAGGRLSADSRLECWPELRSSVVALLSILIRCIESGESISFHVDQYFVTPRSWR